MVIAMVGEEEGLEKGGEVVMKMAIMVITQRWLDWKHGISRALLVDDGHANDDDNEEDDDHCKQVIGPTASAGHYSVPRTSGEFSRDIISRSRSPRWTIISTLLYHVSLWYPNIKNKDHLVGD